MQILNGELVHIQLFQLPDCSTGQAQVQVIGPSSSYVNTSSGSQGYTKNHLNFGQEMDQFQWWASGSVTSVPVTAQVIVARPMAKGSKITLVAIDTVCGYLV